MLVLFILKFALEFLVFKLLVDCLSSYQSHLVVVASNAKGYYYALNALGHTLLRIA